MVKNGFDIYSLWGGNNLQIANGQEKRNFHDLQIMNFKESIT